MKALIILLPLVLMSDIDLISVKDGFMFPSKPVKTYYSGRILWGDHYKDHNKSNPAIGIAVIVWSNSDKWKYATITNNKGMFKVEVNPNSAFKIQASDGEKWHEFPKIIKGVPIGTIGKGK